MMQCRPKVENAFIGIATPCLLSSNGRRHRASPKTCSHVPFIRALAPTKHSIHGKPAKWAPPRTSKPLSRCLSGKNCGLCYCGCRPTSLSGWIGHKSRCLMTRLHLKSAFCLHHAFVVQQEVPADPHRPAKLVCRHTLTADKQPYCSTAAAITPRAGWYCHSA